MKKVICIIMAMALVFAFTACGGSDSSGAGEWTLEGYFMDAEDNMLSITYMDDVTDPGWYVGVMLGEDFIEDSWGGIVDVEGNTLHGTLTPGGSQDELTVTVSEDGDGGVLLALEGGGEYHFTEYDMPTASIFININIEGDGSIGYEPGETTPELDEEYPYQSAVINLAEPENYTFGAWPTEGHKFVKWTKNGEDFSTEPIVTILLDESADYIAVFE